MSSKPGEKALPTPPAFPVEALPKSCQKLAVEASEAIGCPVDYLAVSMLPVLATAIGSTRVIKIKSGWEEPAILWVALVGRSGDKKTPALKEASLPVTTRQSLLAAEYKKKIRYYKQACREYEVQKKNAKEECITAPEPPKRPHLASVFVNDTTPAALVDTLQKNGRGLLRIEDELASMVRSLDQKAGRRERYLWLSIVSGAPLKVDRKNQEDSLYIPQPCVSLIGNIQPDVLSMILPYGEDHDGFFARIMLSYPYPVDKDWFDTEIDEKSRERYQNLVYGLYELGHGVNEITIEEDFNTPVVIHFSPEAKEAFKSFYNKLKRELRTPGFPLRLRAVWAKLDGYTARIALVLAMCRVVEHKHSVPERAEVADVTSAIALAEYFKDMARRVYTDISVERREDLLAADVVSWLEALPNKTWTGSPTEGFKTIREISEHVPNSAHHLSASLRRISNNHPYFYFKADRHKQVKGKLRYWILSLQTSS